MEEFGVGNERKADTDFSAKSTLPHLSIGQSVTAAAAPATILATRNATAWLSMNFLDRGLKAS